MEKRSVHDVWLRKGFHRSWASLESGRRRREFGRQQQRKRRIQHIQRLISLKNMASSSNSDIYHTVDDFYFSALHDNDEIFPISDEKYAEELQLQEALVSSTSLTTPSSSSFPSTSTPLPALKRKQTLLPSEAAQSSESFCGICMDSKSSSEIFTNATVCVHLFCSDCIRGHVSAKIKENIVLVKCPKPKCKGLIGPEICRSIVPKEVLERWEDALCESLILGSHKFYCPFKIVRPCWWMMAEKL
ncbi:unnamed protein product [Lactuca saligna]|uniref:RING-type domain-containing protein n=1 Tax=Lactuca saligna TaxID=75948 RepID=A0AA35Y750_LACSI|nr:unnamed protein product [Lactuca saligna]